MPSVKGAFPSDWARTRKRVLERDGYVCHWCGGAADSADHWVARAHGGTHDDWNLVAACTPCNSKRGGQISSRKRPQGIRAKVGRWA